MWRSSNSNSATFEFERFHQIRNSTNILSALLLNVNFDQLHHIPSNKLSETHLLHIFWLFNCISTADFNRRKTNQPSTLACRCHPVISKWWKCRFRVVIVRQHIIEAILCTNSTCTSNTTNNLKSKHLCHARQILFIQSQTNHLQNVLAQWLRQCSDVRQT